VLASDTFILIVITMRRRYYLFVQRTLRRLAIHAISVSMTAKDQSGGI
jgi:hypothetical protein